MNTKDRIEHLMVIIKAIGLTPQLQYNEHQVSKIIGKSPATLYRERVNGVGIPYKKTRTNSKSDNGKILYPIHSIADYYFDNIV